VAFGLMPGQISDVVKSSFGYHIIKLVDKKPGTTKTLAEVSPAITAQLLNERAQAQAADLGQALAKEISKPADLDKVAKARGMTVQESAFFARDEPTLALDIEAPTRIGVAHNLHIFVRIDGQQSPVE